MFLSKVSSASARLFARSKARAEAETAKPDLRELARGAVVRDIVDFHTVVSVEGLGAFDARLMDISPYCFQCRARSRILERGERAWVLLPLAGERRADAMWCLKGLFGCRFREPIEAGCYADLLPLLHGMHPELLEQQAQPLDSNAIAASLSNK